MYSVSCIDVGTSKDPFLAQLSNFSIIFGNELDAEVCSILSDLLKLE
jgi:endoribonuclease Dicer